MFCFGLWDYLQKLSVRLICTNSLQQRVFTCITPELPPLNGLLEPEAVIVLCTAIKGPILVKCGSFSPLLLQWMVFLTSLCCRLYRRPHTHSCGTNHYDREVKLFARMLVLRDGRLNQLCFSSGISTETK